MDLWTLQKRQRAEIRNFKSGIPAIYLTRLQELGLAQGNTIECVRVTPFHGPRSFQVRDGIFSLDRELAQFVEVRLS